MAAAFAQTRCAAARRALGQLQQNPNHALLGPTIRRAAQLADDARPGPLRYCQSNRAIISRRVERLDRMPLDTVSKGDPDAADVLFDLCGQLLNDSRM